MAFLDFSGLEYYTGKLKAWAAGLFKDNTRSVEFIRGTQTAATGNWTGVSEDSELYDGKHIMYHLEYAGSGNATLNLTLADGTQTGAKAVYFNGSASHVTTHFPAGSVIGLTYIYKPNGTAAQQIGYWRSDADYYTGNNMNRLQNSDAIPCAKALIAGDMAGWNGTGYVPIKAGETIDISYPVLLSLSATAAGATSTQLWYAYENKNIRSMSGMSSKSVTANKMVYIVGTLDGTQFTVGADVLTTTEPSTEDGKVYIPVGVSYSTYQLYFCSMRPFFAFRNGKFGPLEPDLSGYAKTADLASVATTGNYNDLSNRPTIPTVDTTLSASSPNPVQNKAINTALAAKADDSNVVHKTGNETVAGDKTFTGKINFANANNYIQYNSTTGCVEIIC